MAKIKYYVPVNVCFDKYYIVEADSIEEAKEEAEEMVRNDETFPLAQSERPYEWNLNWDTGDPEVIEEEEN